MRPYLEILRLPGALKFCAAGLVARSGGAMMGIGIVLMVSALYGSYGLAGALAAANGVAWAIGTAVLSNLVDRYGQRRVMYPAVVVSSAMLACVVVLAVLQFPVWTLFAPAIISGATGGAPGALVRARWNHLTRTPGQLHTAYALESTLDEVTFVVGPVVATALSVGVHPAAGIVAPVVLALLGAKLFYSQRATEPPLIPRGGAHHEQVPLLRRLVLLVPGVGPVVAVNLLIGCTFGSIDVSIVAATTSWDARWAAGVVLAIFSLGSALAGFYYGSRQWSSPLPGRFAVGVTALLVTCAALLLVTSPLLLAVLGLLVGVTIAPTLINANSLIGRLVPRGRLTEGLSWLGTGIGIGAALGSSVSGQAIDHGGYHAGFIAVALFAAGAAAIVLLSLPVLRRSLVTDEDVTDDRALAQEA